MSDINAMYEKIIESTKGQLEGYEYQKEMLAIRVASDDLLEVAQTLKKDFAFEQLIDLTVVDYLQFGNADWNVETASGSGFSRGVQAHSGSSDEEKSQSGRFVVVSHFLSLEHNMRLRLKVPVTSEDLIVSSISALWPSANWFEREAFDMFGVVFDQHPDLRRILTDYGFNHFPLRKDFPVSGFSEMRYDEKAQDVVYGEVEIEPRILVPRVIRDDNRGQISQQKQEGKR